MLDPDVTFPDAIVKEDILLNNGAEERIISHWATRYTDTNREFAGLICGWQDITDYERVMQELSIEKEAAEKANHTKSTFLATMSHEIRTPISAIIGLLELEVRKQQDNEAIQVAFESAQTLLGLIGDILDMAKIESGQLELAPDWVDFEQLVLPVVRVFERVARQKKLTLAYHGNHTQPLEVYIDLSRFRQIISNYLSNAVKFTHQGRIDVRVHSRQIDADTMMLDIEIQDTGVGISLSDQEKLFKPFAQLEEGRKQTGTGLGLVISSQLLEKMQGLMQLHSTPGHGTQIQIALALPMRTARAKPETTQQNADNGAVLNILAVDDHPANRMVLSQQLTLLGHRVTEAHDGQQALQLWQENSYDVVMTDCNMPGMDGMTLTRQLRASGRPVTILGLTANAQSDIRATCLLAGMDDCLFKPLRLAQLERVLQHVIKRDEPPALRSLLDWDALMDMMHQDVVIVRKILARISDENAQDMAQAMELAQQQDWPALAVCLHRLGARLR
ncbi:hypothetical protein GGER_14680 [Serratia rubidaea]